ncbi:MAG TPA: thiol reductase thioredoxin [Dehalococcoidia bacterium]|nr:thiol reductase thioredoxin [Dehalococcoidia bacterium]
MIYEITGEKFEREVLQSGIPVFACFITSRCGSCFALCLVVEDLVEEYEGRMKFVMVDAEKESELADRYNMLAMPAALLFNGGEPMKKLVGFQSKARIRNTLNELLAEHVHSL